MSRSSWRSRALPRSCASGAWGRCRWAFTVTKPGPASTPAACCTRAGSALRAERRSASRRARSTSRRCCSSSYRKRLHTPPLDGSLRRRDDPAGVPRLLHDVRPHGWGVLVVLLAVMMWHLHLSRTGFMVIAWPFTEMAVLLAALARDPAAQPAAVRARRRRSPASAMYSYNADYLFLPVPFVALCMGVLAPRRVRPGPWRAVAWRWIVAAAVDRRDARCCVYIAYHTETTASTRDSSAVTDTDQWQAGRRGGEHAHIIWRPRR